MPVFVYHDVACGSRQWEGIDASHRPYVLERERLREHLDRLASPGLRCRRLSELVLPAWDNGRREFVITFDDGHISNFEQALPLLLERGLSACFFIIAGRIGTGGHMGWRELRELDRCGMEIGSHSLTHPFMHNLAPAELRLEYARSREILEQGLGRAVVAASLPRGWLGPHVRAAVSEAGYKVFCTSKFGLVTDCTDPLLVPRFPIKAGTSADLVARAASGHLSAFLAVGALEAGKGTLKRMVGVRRWQALRRRCLAAVTVRGGAAGR